MSAPDHDDVPPSGAPAESEEKVAAAPVQPSPDATESIADGALAPARKRRPRKPRAEAVEASAAAVASEPEPAAAPAAAEGPTSPAAPAPRDDAGVRDSDDEDEEEEDDEDEDEDEFDRARRAAEREQRNAPPPEPIQFSDVVSGQFDADETSPDVAPLKRVLLPQAARSALPPWINTGVELIKGSSLLSIIGVGELLLRTQEVIGRTFMTIQFYVFAGIVYLVINIDLDQIGKSIERSVGQH